MLENIRNKFMWGIVHVIEYEIKRGNCSKKNYKKFEKLAEIQWIILHNYCNEEA